MVNLVMTNVIGKMNAVTVLTWVLRDFASIVVHKLVAGEKTPIVCLLQFLLVTSVATHGHGM